MANSAVKVVKWFAITILLSVVAVGVIGVAVLASHSFTNEPNEIYKIGEEFRFEFIEGDPALIKITGVEYNDVLDELWVHVQVQNLDDNVYIDSPYQFKVQDENNRVFVPTIREVSYMDFEIDEIKTGEILAKTFVYKIDDPTLKHTLIINEYIGNGAVGIELFT